MTSLADTELLRARWRRALSQHAVDTVGRKDFGLSPLAVRLRMATVQMLLLPTDPESDVLQLDEDLWAWLAAETPVDVGGRAVRFGEQTYPPAHAAALVSGYGAGEPWNSYLAIHRSTTIELGLGDRGGWELEDRDGQRVRQFNLISIVMYSWALLKFSAALNRRLRLTGPMHLSIALRDTRDARLGNVGEGWAEPGSYGNNAGGCMEESLLCTSNSIAPQARHPSSGSRLRLAIASKMPGASASGDTSPTAANERASSTEAFPPHPARTGAHRRVAAGGLGRIEASLPTPRVLQQQFASRNTLIGQSVRQARSPPQRRLGRAGGDLRALPG